MAKNLNKVEVNLAFSADTGQAKAQLRELKNTLEGLYTSSAKASGVKELSKDVNDALVSAAKLKTSLEAATNVDTGRLDLSKFSQQLKKNDLSLKQYAVQLKNLGPDGEKAFLQLTKSIMQAEVPMRKANAALTEMWTSLKNTARWQISSSMLHGFMGAVQSAYGYAQDLNESLNDIRIVTSYNTDQMAKFAKEANKAAKALSATTTEYTNASLIYFQQGLTDQEVKERTDVTIKMANVSRQSAEIVSDQMTAVWNNFNDGSKSLEYYADVMTALGAATASSSDEIATGLEKFAAVSQTVGLSFDYATAALATVTAETRQSAEVVGTAFKTIFARMEGLNLGETLDDGTDLNKYSAALATVGVQIKDSSGEMRQMDDILSDLGSRWQSLAQDEKIALAQTVAGVRQYNQLIALMDNWDKFQDNLGTAKGSEGTLQEQADIYAESWEAARDRVQASAEAIYGSLLDDKFFIELNNMLADSLDGINGLIDAVGGLPGVIGIVGFAFTKAFGPQLANSINQSIENLKILTGVAESTANTMRKQAIASLQDFNKGLSGSLAVNFNKTQQIADSKSPTGFVSKTRDQIITDQGSSELESQVMIDQINRSYELQQVSSKISEEKSNQLKEMMKIEEQYGKNAVAAKKELEENTNNYTTLLGDFRSKLADSGVDYEEGMRVQTTLKRSLDGSMNMHGGVLFGVDVENVNQLNEATLKWATSITQADEESTKAQRKLREFAEQAGYTTKDLQELAKAHLKQANSQKKSAAATENYKKVLKNFDNELKKGEKNIANFGKSIVGIGSGMTKALTGAMSLASAFETLNDSDLSTFEKFTRITTSLTMGLPSLVSGIGEVTKSIGGLKGGTEGAVTALAAKVLGINSDTIATLANAQAQEELNDKKQEEATLDAAGSVTKQANIAQEGVEAAATAVTAGALDEKNEEKAEEQALTISEMALKAAKLAQDGTETTLTLSQVAALKLENMARGQEQVGIIGSIGAKIAEATANALLSTSMSPVLALTLALVAAMLPYVIIIGAVVGAVYALVKAYNADAEAAENAKQRVEGLTNAYEECKTQAEELKNTLSDLSEAYQELQKLTKGTEEYDKKLQEVNAQAKQLIETYGLFDKYEVVDGMIVFDKGAIEELTSSVNNQMAELERQIAAAKIISNKASLRSEATNLGRDITFKANDDEGSSPSHLSSMDVQSAAKAFAEYEKEINAAKGFQPGDSGYVELTAEKIRQDIKNGVITGVPDVVTEYIDEFTDDNIQSILDFRDSIDKATEANKYYAKEILGASIEEEYGDDFRKEASSESEYLDMVEAAKTYGGNLKNEDGKTLDQLISEINVEGVTSNSALNQVLSSEEQIENDEDLGKLYAEKVLGWSSSDISYSGGTGEGTITNATTGQEMTLDDNFMRQAIAQQVKVAEVISKFESDTGQNMEDFNNALTSMVGSTSEEVSSVLLNALKSEDGQIDYNDFMDDISPEDVEAFKNMSQDELLNKLGITPEQLENLGLDSAEAFYSNFANALAGYDEEAFYENMRKQADQILTAGAAELDMTKEALEAYTQDLMENNEHLAKNEKLAAEVAVASARMSIGLDKLEEKLNDNVDTLKSAEKNSLDYYEALGEVQTALEETFGVDVDADFIEENLELIEKAATGDVEAVNELRKVLSQDILCNIKAVDNFDELDPQIQTLSDKLNELSVEDVKVGATLETGDFMTTAQELVNTAGMSVEEAQSYFNSLGYEPEFVTEEKVVTTSVPQTRTHTDYDITWGTVDILGQELPIPTIDRLETTSVVGNKDVEQVMQVPAVGADGTPQIKSLTKTGGTTPLKSSKATGGSGKSSKPSKTKKTKKSDLVERYKEINDSLDDISDSMEKLNKQTDRLYGAARIKAMQEQLKVLKQEEKALEQKRKQAEAYLKIDKQLLLAEAKKQGLNFSFDENGNITNIESELEKKMAELNAKEEAYNNMSADEQEKYSENTLEPLREEIEDLKDAISQYYETVETIEDIDVALQDNDYAQEDTELAMIEYAVEVQLEVDERQFKQLERLLKRIEDRAFSAADAIANLGLQASSTIDSLDVNKQGISDILKKNGLTDEEIEGFLKGDQAVVDKVSGMEFSAGDIEALKTFMDGLTESVDLLIEIRKQVHDKILSAFEECNETIDKGIEKLNYLKSVTESFANIIDLLGKANFKGSTELIKQLNEAQVAQSGDIAKANIAKRDMMATNLANAKATLEQQRHKLSEEEIKMWEDSIAEMESQLQDAELEAMSSIEAWMQAINDAFIAEIEASIERFSDTVAGEFKSLSQLQEAFDRRSDLADNYLQDYQKIYEFSKLNRDIENSIDHTDSIAGKKTLLELTEKITALEESGAKVSQYQVDSLRAQYELKMAQIALEEAQNAKTQVIRRRDEEGNYGYVYTADQEALGEAYQTYEDKLYAWQELNQTFIQETQEAMIGLQAEMEQKMMEIAQDESLSVDERKAKMAELYAYYEEQFNYYKEQLGVGFEDAQLIYNDDWTKYAESTGYKISADENFIDSFGETQLSMLTGFETMEEYQAAFNQASETLLDESIDAFNTWQSDMETGPLAAMGTTFEDFAEDVGGYLDDVQQSSEDTREKVEGDADLMVGTYQGVLDAIVVWEDQYSQFIQRVVDESDDLINAFNTILTLWSQVNNIANSGEEDQPTQEDQPTKEEQDKALAARAAEIVKGVHYGTIKQTKDGWKPSAKAAGYTDEEIALALKVINDSKAGWSYEYNYKTAMKLLGYDTGGYTGEWGPEGRLALLHQKEIVLNARDTENMLAMTQMVRDIAKRIDLTAVPTNHSIAPTAVASANEGIEQNITIHAEFPDAVNQKEIEEAFNNLFIRVSQYANRKD